MGASTRDVGGGPATGLADSFTSALQGLLNGGGVGPAGSPSPGGTTSGIYGILQGLLQPGGGTAGSAIHTLINQQQTRDVNALRSRFGQGGGTAYGTPGAVAESNYRAGAAPQFMNALTGLQLQAISSLLGPLTNLSGRGISQRQTIQEENPATQGLGVLAQVAKAGAGYITHGASTAITGASAATNGVDSGGYTPPNQNTSNGLLPPTSMNG